MPLKLCKLEMFVATRPEYRFDMSCTQQSFSIGTNQMKRFIEQVSSLDGRFTCRNDTLNRRQFQASLVTSQQRNVGDDNDNGHKLVIRMLPSHSKMMRQQNRFFSLTTSAAAFFRFFENLRFECISNLNRYKKIPTASERPYTI